MDPADRDPEADEHDGVRLVSTEDQKSDQSRTPAIDVVHVMGINTNLERLPLSQILSQDVTSVKRELVFTIETPFLADDIILTLELIEGEARRLLAGLKHFRHSRSFDSAIVFVAYDLGALVVKRAIAVAENDAGCSSWVDVFARTVRFVFHGCFQRRLDDHDAVMRMVYFLRAHGDNMWAQTTTSRATEQLVKAIIEVNGVFLGSDVIHRSRIFSLYAVEPSPRRIPKVFDWHTATMGLPTEVAVRNGSEDGGFLYPLLAEKISFGYDGWIPEPSLAAVQWTLASAVPRQYQIRSTCESSSHPLLHSTPYRSWLRSSGVRILYLHGPSYAATTEAAEQVGLAWTTRTQAEQQYESRPFMFMFSAKDPAHNAVRHMLAASMLQCLAELSNTDPEDCVEAQVLQDMLDLKYDWTDELVCKAIEWAVTLSGPYVLFDMDECTPCSRMTLWSYLASIAEKTETSLKLVVASKRPGSLLKELQEIPEIVVDEYRVSAAEDKLESSTDPDFLDTMIRRFCPRRLGETRIRKCLEKLAKMNRPVLESIVDLLSSTTRWPEVMTCSNLDRFCDLLESVSCDSTAATTLSSVLLSVDDQSGLQWVLGWLLCAYRPFQVGELAAILCYAPSRLESKSPPSEIEVRTATQALQDMLAGIVSWRNNRIEIIPDVSSLLSQDDETIWSRLRRSAAETTVTFLLEYLALPATQRRLDQLFLQYRSRFESFGEFGTPALVPKEPGDLIFYAVQALPHHLDATVALPIHLDTTVKLKDPNGPFSAWSRLYWAMSNPFSRPSSGPYSSARETWRRASLVDGLVLDADEVTGQDLAKADDEFSPMDHLFAAVSANKEDSALRRAQQLVDHAGLSCEAAGSAPGPTISWPSALLRAATWLNMPRLMRVLLRNGANVNDHASKLSPSLIYTASRLGYPEMVELFISHGADITTKRRGVYSALHTAACNGHVDLIKALVAHRSDLVNVEQPLKPLYAASVWGCWKAVEYLVKLPGADPDEKHTGGWTPLTTACDDSFIKTAQALLDSGADPNITGPDDRWTPLYYAAAIRGDTDIVRALLARGATIELDILDEPLLCGIINNGAFSVEEKISLCEILIQHDPSINLDKGRSNGLTPLMLAASNGDATMVRWLLRHGSDINLTTLAGEHALFFALFHRHVAATKELLAHDTPPALDVESTYNAFPLGLAVADENTQDDGTFVEMILDAGANLEFENKKKETVLAFAVYRGQVEVVRLLLKRGADIHHRDMWHFTPLLRSAHLNPAGITDILRLLIDSGANLEDKQSDNFTALHFAMWEANLDKVRVLLEYRASIDIHSPNSNGDTPLLVSTRWDRPQIVECLRLLVRAGADVNAQNSKGWCLLMKSSLPAQEASAVHDFLLSLPETKVDLVAPAGGYPLQVACRTGYMELLHKLLARGSDVNLAVPGFAPTALISACVSNSGKTDETVELIVRELVARGADASFMSKNTVGVFNALCAASFQAGVGTINFLLDSGAPVQQPDPIGRLPIHFAAAHGLRNFEVVARAYTGDIMAADNAGKNVLHWAAQFGNLETVKAIFERIPGQKIQAAVDCKDVDGWTPLAWAMRPVNLNEHDRQGFSEQRNYAGTVQFLVQKGANVNVTFQQGRGETAEVLTLAELAERCGADNLARLLFQSQKPEIDQTATDADGETGTIRSTRYISRDFMCHICLSTVYGLLYQCQTCPSVRFCKKCHSNIELYHIVDDGQLHTFDISSDGSEEYMPPISPSLSAASKVGNPILEAEVDAQGQSVDNATRDANHGSPQDDVTEEVDFSDLKDLGSFTDSE